MSYSIQTMFPGDIFDSALRLGSDTVDACASKEDTREVMQEAWQTATQLGWTAFVIPEVHGGVGAGFKDLAGVIEGMGHSGCSLPVAELCHAVPTVLEEVDTDYAANLMARLAGGEVVVALAHADARALSVTRAADGFLIRGEIHAIEAGSTPAVVLVTCKTPSGEPLILAVQLNRPEITQRFYLRMDGRVVMDLRLDGLKVGTEHVLLRGDTASEALRRVESFGILFSAIECVAGMGRLVGETIEYLKNRQQFGTTLVNFQVLRHAVADMYVDYESLKAQTQALIDETTDSDIDARRCSLLMISLAQTGRRVGESAVQLHGGMGMTEELLAARLAKRMIYAGFEHGGECRHLTLAAHATFSQERTQ